jgi:hypothetical protein
MPEAKRRESIGTMKVRKGAKDTALTGQGGRGLVRLRRVGGELRMARQERSHHRLILFRLERTGRVDNDTAGAHKSRGRLENLHLSG